ncbi:MAG: hypothetical protein O3B84_05980 [Chloroflexi bacterium]|nr:hypothetical protein [Chloroflexota bacterium]
MAPKIFVNLPVENLQGSVEFFSSLGFSFNAEWSDTTGTCMVISKDIYATLLTEDHFRTFTPKQINDTAVSAEVLLTVTCDSRDAVDEMVLKAALSGGSSFRGPQDLGFCTVTRGNLSGRMSILAMRAKLSALPLQPWTAVLRIIARNPSVDRWMLG